MKQTLTQLLLGLALLSQPLQAAEKDNNTSSFWDTLRGKIESLAPQKRLGVTTATGGVRGAAAASDDMYWKNDASAQVVGSDELEAFTKAVKLADSNDKSLAQAAFSEFVRNYPESTLRKDADQAVALLQKAAIPAK